MPKKFPPVAPSFASISSPVRSTDRDSSTFGDHKLGISHAGTSGVQEAVGSLGSRILLQSPTVIPSMSVVQRGGKGSEEIKGREAIKGGGVLKSDHDIESAVTSPLEQYSQQSSFHSKPQLACYNSMDTQRALSGAASSMRNVITSMAQGGVDTLYHLSNFLRQVRPVIALTGALASREATAVSVVSLLLLHMAVHSERYTPSGRVGKYLKNAQRACSALLDPIKKMGDCVASNAIESTLNRLGCGNSRQKTLFKIVSIGLAIINSRTTDKYLVRHFTNPIPMRNVGSSFGFEPASHNANAIAHKVSLKGISEKAGFVDMLKDFGLGMVGFAAPNQLDGIQAQLESGSRALMLDVRVGGSGKLLSTHDILPYGDFSSVLRPIKDYLSDADNNESILLFIENQNDVSLQQFRDVFSEAGLSDYLPDSSDQWSAKLSGNNEIASSKNGLYPIITRTWNTENSALGYDFARGRTIIGDDRRALTEAISGPRSNHAEFSVVMLESNYKSLSIDKRACPLSCSQVNHEFCVRILNHFGPAPFPRIFNFLDDPRELLQEHMDNCVSDTDKTSYAAVDHTSFYRFK